MKFQQKVTPLKQTIQGHIAGAPWLLLSLNSLPPISPKHQAAQPKARRAGLRDLTALWAAAGAEQMKININISC